MNLSNVIMNPINNIPKNEKSHVLGWEQRQGKPPEKGVQLDEFML